ncbi:hypothetical protein AX14_004973 [Amanita brunnescens Koide BX004]|nr:hypothetical protein AX14_004973 [Amanita brunnescens Koide BX004]
MPHNGKTCPDGGERPLMLMEMSDASLRPDVKTLCCVPVPSPPVRGEASLTMKQLLSRKAVSEDKETRADTCSPMPSAALSLPERTPILSTQAVSSCQGRNESHSPPNALVVPKRHESTSVVSPASTASVNAHLVTKCDAHPLALNNVVNRPGVSLPFQGKHRSPASETPSHQAEETDKQDVLPCPSNGKTKPPLPAVLKPIQQPVKKAAVSNSRLNTSTCSPVPTAADKPPAPAVSTRGARSRPPTDESKPIWAAPKLSQPIRKAVVSKNAMNTALCLPSFPVIPTPLTHSVPVTSI